MFDWLENSKLLFFSQTEVCGGYSIFIQSLLTLSATIIGAIGGAFATNYIRNRTDRRRDLKNELQKLNSLAISVLFKISKASSSQQALFKSFFEDVPDGTDHSDMWRKVLPAAPIEAEIWKLTEEEFEFLLGEKKEDADLAHEIVEFLDSAQITMNSMNEYSRQRRELAIVMDEFIEAIEEDTRAIISAYDSTKHPGVHRQVLEISDFCAMVHNRILENLEIVESIAERINEKLPRLTKNPQFSRTIMVGKKNE